MTSTISDTTVFPGDTIGVVDADDKVCADCARLIGVRHRVAEIESWRCGHENNTGKSDDKATWRKDLVTGLKYRIFKVEDIRVVRETQCKGDWYEKYIQPVREPTIGGSVAIEFDEDALAANKDAATKRVEEIRAKRNAKLSKDDLSNL